MRLSNNQVFTSTTALFDETIFPKCVNGRVRGTTRLNEPLEEQPPIDAGPLPPQPIPSGTDDDTPYRRPPKHKKESASDHDGDPEVSDKPYTPHPPPPTTTPATPRPPKHHSNN